MSAVPHRTVVIGLTGPIGCGKSTVAAWLADLGAMVIDADQVARALTAPGTQALREVVATFGEQLLRDDGSLDRAALGRRVFGDPAALAALEAIVHPAVRPVILSAIEAAARSGAPGVVVEAIKLVEGGLAAHCDEVWLVTCRRREQRKRLAGRGMAAAEAGARIAAQAGIERRIRSAATRVIDTSGSAEDARALVTAAWQDALGAPPRRRSATPTA